MSDTQGQIPVTIAVDWGTTRLRAYLLAVDGAILGRISRPDGGMQQVGPGGFAEALQSCIGDWLRLDPMLSVVMAGMVGSRNGWAEAPYAATPASAPDLARQMITVTRADGGAALIVPGVIVMRPGHADVMRGEETLIFGCGVDNAVVILPGTHSKWAKLSHGHITDFYTFMTGETYAWARNSSILSRLATEPEDHSGFQRGLSAAQDKAGLTHMLFSARSSVLAGLMTGEQVGPYLSGLLIGAEIHSALQCFHERADLILVADGAMGDLYQQALHFYGLSAKCIAPDQALVAGLAALQAHR